MIQATAHIITRNLAQKTGTCPKGEQQRPIPALRPDWRPAEPNPSLAAINRPVIRSSSRVVGIGRARIAERVGHILWQIRSLLKVGVARHHLPRRALPDHMPVAHILRRFQGVPDQALEMVVLLW